MPAPTQNRMAKPAQLETPRLVLRPLTVEDFEPFYARLVCDPVVLAFYHAYAQPLTEDERRERAQRDFFDHFARGQARFGYVCWAVTARAPVASETGVRSPPASCSVGPGSSRRHSRTRRSARSGRT